MIEEIPDELTIIPAYKRRPAKVLVPLLPGSDNETMLQLARWLSQEEPVLVVGIVPVAEGENLSTGVGPARELRKLINDHTDRVSLRARARIRVSHHPWDEIRMVLAGESGIDLLLLNWPHHFDMMRLTPAEILSHPPCDVAVVRGPLPERLQRVLVPIRGGPHAERTLRLALALAAPQQTEITTLHLQPAIMTPEAEAHFTGIALVLAELPKVKQRQADMGDHIPIILESAQEMDMIILGTAAEPNPMTTSFGEITDAVLAQASGAVIAMKTRRSAAGGNARFSSKAISVLVDRWFAENTFHADEFADLRHLMTLKEETGLTISLALPALNEEATIADVIQTAQRSFCKKVPLLDELILMDSNSTDRTRDIAFDLGIPVYMHQEVLPQYGTRTGKGEALWKSLYVTNGDIVIWADTDVSNFHPRFIYGLLGPLLNQRSIMFVKGFYRRPFKTGMNLQANQGGRVTELTARPLLNLFYPELSGIVQPLSGEYSGRRSALEQMTFTSGYGVETSLLIDALEKFKLAAIAQVDLVERIHRHQSLFKLSKMSFAIIQTLFSKLERRYGHSMLLDVNRTMKSVFYEPGHFYLQVEEIAELERPPMIEIPEYRQKWGLPLEEGQQTPN